MAARWGAGEETLTACNMDLFQLDKLDGTSTLSSEETLEALQNCLDPSILSIFEDAPTIETKGLDEESEATLLTALTEILDNVDDENLSPFDTLPDSDLLSGQKAREHSPFRRLLCLSRSPPEKETLCNGRPSVTGKSLPRIKTDTLQRSDGEDEEDGSLTLSPIGHSLLPDNKLPDWEGLAIPFPVNFEQEGQDGVSVSLGDLVRQMHPYCMTISVENEEGEQILPEGGILLEVVDQGENGEPILAIPDMDLPVSLPCKEQSKNEKLSDETSNSSERVVDDNGIHSKAPANIASPLEPVTSDTKAEMVIPRREGIKEKSPSRRKKKKKKKTKTKCQPKPVGGNNLQVQPTEPEDSLVKEGMKDNVAKVLPEPALPLPVKPNTIPNVPFTEPEINEQIQTPALPRLQKTASNAPPDTSGSITVACSQQSSERPGHLDPVSEEMEGSLAAPLVSSDTPRSPSQPISPDVSDSPPPVAPSFTEPKPKSLSLAEYRQLRQQKKPTPVEKMDGNNSSKWPSLPVLPKELLPIPCLPNLSTRDPRCTNLHTGRRVVEDVKPAWQPRGPCAPPTPEALLVPPAYMVSSTSKVPAVEPQKTLETSKSPISQTSPHLTANSIDNGAVEQHITTVPSAPSHPLKSEKPYKSPTSGGESRPALLEGNARFNQRVLQLQTRLRTTTEEVESAAASSANVEERGAFFMKGQEISVSTVTDEATAVSENKDNPRTVGKAQKPKTSTQELIEAFTSEIGIEAPDLTSLLEQFEETQAKEEQCVLGVSGRAAAVGNSGFDAVPEKTVVERVRVNDLSSTAALTPPATPPHQMWKPLAPVALLGKGKATEVFKSSPSKVIQIEARPLPSFRSRSRPTPVAAHTVAPEVACMDHDYCLYNKSTGETGKRWNIKQQSVITIKPIKPTTTTVQTPPAAPVSSAPLIPNATKAESVLMTAAPDHRTDRMENSSVLESPDASPTQQETFTEENSRKGPFGRSYRQHVASHSLEPKQTTRSRSRKRSHRSPSPLSSSSDSDSSRSRSRSSSPSKKRYRRHHSNRSSSSSSHSSSVSQSPPRRRRYSYSSSRSGSWSRSRSRSVSPERVKQSRRLYRPSLRPGFVQSAKTNLEMVKKTKERAIEERRVVYVGRIRGTMTQKELKERFSLFGEIEDCTLHFRNHGDNYGFVTYYDTKDAFAAIENGFKLRKPDELPFDLCFGGRRQFCQTSYADLDSSTEYEPYPAKGKFHALDFDTLLKQAQQNLKR
ncbi:peroxisome proliferator-activated receptor gamma coactivator-related protein 1 [Takifugu rubripes]|uniref:PPARG related coactivator 1 n=1 Tax=Takifugu rubripes TaxID=31033 RepID=H2TWP2_TAKRU|nr:peroxisome proliferator-activated receptor gamma coactivator-related protein 1 [Takifugu rubripes]